MSSPRENTTSKDKQVPCSSGAGSTEPPNVRISAQQSIADDNLDPTYSKSVENDDVSMDKVDEAMLNSGMKRQRARTSSVWNDFEEVIVGDVKKSRCKYCKTTFVISKGGSTSSIKRHKCLVCPDNMRQNALSFGISKVSGFAKESTSEGVELDPNKIREIIAKMVVCHEYAFNIVENCWFRFLMKLAFPRVPISRTIVKRDVTKLYEVEKKKLKEYFKGVTSIALTTDMWTSNQQIGYISITAHFIDHAWTLQKRIIGFNQVESPHTGKNLANVIAKNLQEWEIKKKIISITVDNASSNDVLVRTLKEILEKSGVNLYQDGKFFHVCCCAHILNLMVQDGLFAIRDELGKIREAVKYIKCSPSRLHNFQVIVDEFEIRGQKKLVLDVATQWNSTYLMLKVALMYRHVFDRYVMEDAGFTWLLDVDEWERVQKICTFLEAFYNVFVLFSGSKYPTTNLLSLEIWVVQELLQEEVVNGCNFTKRIASKMKEEFDKYWSSCNILMAIASILDPRVKFSLTDFVLSKAFSQIEEKEYQMTLVRNTMQELYNSYVAKIEGLNKDVECDATTFMRGTDSSCRFSERFFSFLSKANNVHFQAPKSELDMYLEDGLLKCDATTHDSFDILIWWKDKELKYPILSHMARDILCIPMTTVVSESAFSTGGRILDECRSSLSPKTVEELVCAGDWIKQYGDPMNLVPVLLKGTAEDDIAI